LTLSALATLAPPECTEGARSQRVSQSVRLHVVMAASSAAAPSPGVGLENPKVVYVMGTARSGSTILGVTLGNCTNIFYAGELGGWLVKSGVSSLDGSERARLWKTVCEDVDNATELFGEETRLCVENSSALFRVDRWPRRRRLLPHWRRIASDLYRAITRATGATHVVDTSSHPLRAWELKKVSGIDLYIVYLVRNPREVVASFTNPGIARYAKSILVTNAYIWVTNLLSVFVFLRHPSARRIFVCHEDFVANPEGVLYAILKRIDSDAAIPDLTSLHTGLAFQGNRLLRAGDVIALKRPTAAAAAPARAWLTTVLQAPWPALHSRLRPAAATCRSRADVKSGSAGGLSDECSENRLHHVTR
jgi:hypothetical protein